MIDVSDISLLYPDGESMRRAGLGEGGARLSDVTAEQLELYYLIDLKNSDIGSFFTCDVETIRYRQQTFADMASGCTCPRGLPVCVCGKKPKGKLPFKSIAPSDFHL